MTIDNYALGQQHLAIEHHTEALTIARALGDRRGESHALGDLVHRGENSLLVLA